VQPLETERLILVPMSLGIVEAVLSGDRTRAESLAEAELPPRWPGPDLVARAFSYDLDQIRRDPEKRLWGDRLLITRTGPRKIVGSVVFHGRPDEDGMPEIGYGVEESHQRKGYATEATRACVAWAFAHPAVRAVCATTFPWHTASRRVIDRLGMTKVGERAHDVLGDLWVFAVDRERWDRL
jgi:RimJ/RimL family protein N-acetyltransferase